MLTAALYQVSQMGWMRPEEIRWIARLSDRMSARAYAKRVAGKPAAAARSGVPANHDRDRFPAQSSRERDSPG